MKSLIYLCVLFFSLGTMAQQRLILPPKSKPFFEIEGSADLIARWKDMKTGEVTAKLSNGDDILIKPRQSEVGLDVFVKHGNMGELLSAATSKNLKNLEDILVEVYEYDFDKDGNKEILVIYTTESVSLKVEVFRYSIGLSKKIGNFNGQTKVILDDDMINLPYGGQGLSNGYLFKNGAFFELIYHNPNKDL